MSAVMFLMGQSVRRYVGKDQYVRRYVANDQYVRCCIVNGPICPALCCEWTNMSGVMLRMDQYVRRYVANNDTRYNSPAAANVVLTCHLTLSLEEPYLLDILRIRNTFLPHREHIPLCMIKKSQLISALNTYLQIADSVQIVCMLSKLVHIVTTVHTSLLYSTATVFTVPLALQGHSTQYGVLCCCWLVGEQFGGHVCVRACVRACVCVLSRTQCVQTVTALCTVAVC
jgi:hypothetical protein